MSEKVVKKPKKKLIIILVIVVVVVVGLFLFLRMQAAANATGGSVMPDILVLSKTDLESKVTASGNFASTDPVSIGSNVTGGEVEKVYVEAGDRVLAGDVLAKLKTSDIERGISDANYALSEAAKGDRQRKEQAERAVNDAEADYSASKKQTDDAVKKADSAYKAAKAISDAAAIAMPPDPELADKEAATAKAKAELDAAKVTRDNTMRGASSRVTEARATLDGLQGTDNARQQRSQLDSLKENLDNASIVSPITGIVTRVATEAGKVVMGDMFIVEDTESLQISASVAEYDVIKIQKGMTAHITSNATGNEVYDGLVDFVAPKASDTSGNFEVNVVVTSGVGQLKPGMTATVEIVIESKKNVFAVPIDAVVTKPDGKKVVYAYEPGGTGPMMIMKPVGDDEGPVRMGPDPGTIVDEDVPQASGPVRVAGPGPGGGGGGPQAVGAAPVGGGVPGAADAAPFAGSRFFGGPDGSGASFDFDADTREIEVTTGMETDYYIEIISDELNEGMLILSDPMGLSVSGGGFGGFNMMGGPPPSDGTAVYRSNSAGVTTVTVME